MFENHKGLSKCKTKLTTKGRESTPYHIIIPYDVKDGFDVQNNMSAHKCTIKLRNSSIQVLWTDFICCEMSMSHDRRNYCRHRRFQQSWQAIHIMSTTSYTSFLSTNTGGLFYKISKVFFNQHVYVTREKDISKSSRILEQTPGRDKEKRAAHNGIN